jgi:rare lipoprotein A
LTLCQKKEVFMKLLSSVLVIGLFFSGLCFAQTQTGNASYNASKNGLTIAHSSMSFGTKVRVTNLKNNREVIATVDGRIPASDPRIADISQEAGDAIGMSPTGYTEVQIEHIVVQQAVSPSPAPQTAPQIPPSTGARETPVPAPLPASQEPQFEPAQPDYPPIQYVVVPASGQNQGCPFPFCLAILILLIVAVLLLAAILVLILYAHRIPWWPWYYPLWFRRHLRYLKKHT